MKELDPLQRQVLAALVEGFAARKGLKDRLKALNEWEIARRSGFEGISYAGYATHPARERIGLALAALEAAGLIAPWHRGPQYVSYVPTEAGARLGTERPL